MHHDPLDRGLKPHSRRLFLWHLGAFVPVRDSTPGREFSLYPRILLLSQDIYFTADTHFNHRKCLELFRVGRFASMEEMNETMIDRWNSRIKRSDRVYHLGDFALGRQEDAKNILDCLNGQIYLIRGNHEAAVEGTRCRDRFVWIKDYHCMKVGEQKIVLCHYAFRTWNCMHYGSWNLHGHSHGSLPEIKGSRSLDVGVDCWDFYPVNFYEVRTKMIEKTFQSVDHHGGDDEHD